MFLSDSINKYGMILLNSLQREETIKRRYRDYKPFDGPLLFELSVEFTASLCELSDLGALNALCFASFDDSSLTSVLKTVHR